jgi:hypothetical protein
MGVEKGVLRQKGPKPKTSPASRWISFGIRAPPDKRYHQEQYVQCQTLLDLLLQCVICTDPQVC